MDDSLVSRRSRRSTAGNRMQQALAEMALDIPEVEMEDDRDFVAKDDGNDDQYASDFKSTDDEEPDAGEIADKALDAEERREKRAAKAKTVKYTSARAVASGSSGLGIPHLPPRRERQRRLPKSVQTAINKQTGEVVGLRTSRRETTRLSRLETDTRLKEQEERRLQNQSVPRKRPEKLQRKSQAELLQAALDLEDINLASHRNFLKDEEERRKKAKIVRTAVEGPRLRILSRRERVKLPDAPARPLFPPLPPGQQGKPGFPLPPAGRGKGLPTPPPFAAPPGRGPTPYPPPPLLLGPGSSPSAAGKAAAAKDKDSSKDPFRHYVSPADKGKAGKRTAPQPNRPPPPPPPPAAQDVKVGSTTRILPEPIPVAGASSSAAAPPLVTTSQFPPSFLNWKAPPNWKPPIIPGAPADVYWAPPPGYPATAPPIPWIPARTGRGEVFERTYVGHVGEDEDEKPSWEDTMEAMFGNEVDWANVKVYVDEKGRKAPPLERVKQYCPITGRVAGYRDPKTGTPFADVHAYKTLMAVLEQRFVWSEALGAYVGREGEMDVS